MKIDKSKLRIGTWYEDEKGELVESEDVLLCEAPKGARTYHTCFPLQITESIHVVYSKARKESCKHDRKYWEKDTDLRVGMKGHTCTVCGCTQLKRWWQPWGKKWDCGKSVNFTPLYNLHTNISGGNQDIIIAMVNSGDYTLSEALVVFSSACERCTNVLAYKYLNGADGYAEYSDEWKKCNTECDFCKDS